MANEYITSVLRALCQSAGVNGLHETTEVAKELLRQYTDDILTDVSGNIIASIPAKRADAPVILLEAHMDEIGFIVTEVDDAGFLRVSPCGGVDLRCLAAAPVIVWGEHPLSGVFCTVPPHLKKKEDENTPLSADALRVDIGMNAIDAKAAVHAGDRISFVPNFTVLKDGRVTSKALDNRAGMAAVLYALSLLKEKDCPYTVRVLFASGEELGCRGAIPGAFTSEGVAAIVTDVSFAHTPDAKPEECGTLGKGAMIGIAPTLDRKLSDAALTLAKRQAIRHQTEVVGGKTGTDADVITVSKNGIPTALLSIPLRYMHTPVETVDTGDIVAVGELMAAMLAEGVF